MSALDNLPPDQRAVLQMVLQRGRSYDEIASLLSIDRAAVRRRALDAFGALAPASVPPGPESALVTDYLLRQLPDRVADQVHAYLEASDSDRAWAAAVAASLEPVASGSLPEIPVGAPLGADDWSAGGLEVVSDPPRDEPDELLRTEELPRTHETPRAEQAPRAEEAPPPRRPSSRRGGAILLGVVGAAIVAAILVVVLSSGGNRKRPATHTVSTVAAQSTTTPTNTGTTGTSTTATLHMLAQLNLTSPNGAGATVGIVQVIREGGVVGLVIDAQGMPANTAHNAYAVWLYNSPSSHRLIGFVPNLVGKSGKLVTEGKLPAGASRYHRLLITLETQQKPSAPGEVVLSGPFREHT